MPLGVSDIDSLKDGVKSDLATKQYQIQGQDGQSYLLTVAGKFQACTMNRALDFFQDWWAKVTHGVKMVGHFLK